MLQMCQAASSGFAAWNLAYTASMLLRTIIWMVVSTMNGVERWRLKVTTLQAPRQNLTST